MHRTSTNCRWSRPRKACQKWPPFGGYNRTEYSECVLLNALASLASLVSLARFELADAAVGSLTEGPDEADDAADALGVPPLTAAKRLAALPRPDVVQPHACMLLTLGLVSWAAPSSATRPRRSSTLCDSSSRRCGLLPEPLPGESGMFHGIFSSHGTWVVGCALAGRLSLDLSRAVFSPVLGGVGCSMVLQGGDEWPLTALVLPPLESLSRVFPPKPLSLTQLLPDKSNVRSVLVLSM